MRLLLADIELFASRLSTSFHRDQHKTIGSSKVFGQSTRFDLYHFFHSCIGALHLNDLKNRNGFHIADVIKFEKNVSRFWYLVCNILFIWRIVKRGWVTITINYMNQYLNSYVILVRCITFLVRVTIDNTKCSY